MRRNDIEQFLGSGYAKVRVRIAGDEPIEIGFERGTPVLFVPCPLLMYPMAEGRRNLVQAAEQQIRLFGNLAGIDPTTRKIESERLFSQLKLPTADVRKLLHGLA
jgi:hypothetical protein